MKKIHELVKNFSKEKGFDTQSLEENFMLLTEEVGELAKAVRKHTSVKIGKHSENKEIGEEAADMLYVLIEICNKFNIDLEKAFYYKMEKIKKRMK